MTKVKGQGSIVTASFDGKSKSLFSSLTANKHSTGARNLVLLSIKGNDYCRGDYLGAIVEQSVGKYEFTTFLIADEIYWHNLKSSEDIDPADENNLKHSAIKLGEQFFEEQLTQFLKPLGIKADQFQADHVGKSVQEKIDLVNALASKYKFEIRRWKDWVAQTPETIESYKKDIFELYSNDLKLKKTLHEQADNFAKRHEDKDLQNYSLLYMRSRGYLQEESFYIIWLSAFLNYNFIVYPGEMPKPFAATKEYFVKSTDLPCNPLFVHRDKPERLVNWLEVNFVRKPGPQDPANPSDLDKTGLSQLKRVPKRWQLESYPGCNHPYNGPGFFVKTPCIDKYPVNNATIATIAGVSKTVLESELPMDLKKNYINEVVDLLSMETVPLDANKGGMQIS